LGCSAKYICSVPFHNLSSILSSYCFSVDIVFIIAHSLLGNWQECENLSPDLGTRVVYLVRYEVLVCVECGSGSLFTVTCLFFFSFAVCFDVISSDRVRRKQKTSPSNNLATRPPPSIRRLATRRRLIGIPLTPTSSLPSLATSLLVATFSPIATCLGM